MRKMKSLFMFFFRNFLVHIVVILPTTNLFADLPENAPPLPPPSGTVVEVETWSELINAVWYLESNTTIIIQPGIYTIPEYWFINVGIDEENPITNVTIRGATGNFDDVIIKGTAPGMAGATSFGFYINNATNVTIADLSVGEVYHHAVQLNPPAIGAANGVRLYHCRFYDCGEQIIKGNFLYDNENLPAGVKNGSIEYCQIEYTDWGPEDGYTEGIDLHGAENWTISHNLFRNIRVLENNNHTDVPAILIWNNSKNVNVSGNTFINCDRGIAFGLYDRTTLSGYAEVDAGIISNNMFYRQQNEVFYNDAAILAWDVRAVKIINNTVFDEVETYPAIEYRFVKNYTDVTIINNLVNSTTNGTEPPIWDRDNDLGNPEEDYENALVVSNFIGLTLDMLSLQSPGDLHLDAENANTLFGIATSTDCLLDFDGEERSSITHYGADQFFSGNLATHSFTNYSGGTHPNTLSISGNQIQIDLSAISGAHIYRAHLNPGKNFNYYNLTANSFFITTMTLTCNLDTLELIPPRYKTFDASFAANTAINTSGVLTFTIEDYGGGFGEHVSLDVLCDVALAEPIQQASGSAANFINGDALITFEEVDPPLTEENPTYADFLESYQNVMNGNIRYRIYRSTSPIETSVDILNLELIDEIYPLTGWDPKFHGPERVFPYIGKVGTVTRLPIADGELTEPGIGIYANRYNKQDAEQTAWYFISRTVDGAEDFSTINSNGNVTNAVTESAGTGAVLLHSVVQSADFIYEGPTTLYYYVKWECFPAATFPNDVSNYLVALRDDIDYSAINPGVIIKLHSWGGTMSHSFGWWHYADQGHILVSGNQFPWQNWWLGHHSSLGTLKSYHDGSIKPFSAQRFLDFVFDNLQPLYSINQNKIVLSGTSMGGTGASIIGTRNGHIFSNLIGWVGVHSPAKSPTFEPSFELAFGDSAWHCNFSNVDFAAKYGGQEVLPEDNYDVWRYFDNAHWLANNPKVELPWHTFSNGSNDVQIGWPQAQEYAENALNYKAPLNFTWGTNGHEQRARVLDPYGYETDRNSNQVFCLNQSFPVFTNSSMAGNLQVDVEGQMNNYFKWHTDDIVDVNDRWEMSIGLIPASPQESVSTSITPRRLQGFNISANAIYSFELYEEEQLVSSGVVNADENAFITINNLEISKNIRRLIISPSTETVLTTLATTNVGTSTATANGNIFTLGSPGPTAHGFCWSMHTNPDLNDSHSDEGPANAPGAFSSDLTWLSGSTTYYFRAYTTSVLGTVYGNELSFTTNNYGHISWTGAQSGDWNEAENWSGSALPTVDDDVVIPTGQINYPIISGGASGDCHDLSLESGATFSIRSGGSFITTGNINNEGNILTERNIGDGQWHLISSPVTNASAEIFEGHFLQQWSETDASWTDISNPSTPLTPVRGYGFWGVAEKGEYTFSGTPNTGHQSLTLTLSNNFPDPEAGNDGANLLGNPYPSAIDWCDLDDKWGAVYYWDPSANAGAGDYIEWNNGVGSGYQFIPPMQGFFIVVDESNTTAGSATFAVGNTNRTHSGATQFYKSEFTSQIILEAKSGNNKDELFIVFNDEASLGFDLKFDALKFFSGVEGVSQLCSYSENIKLAIDVRPETESIQLYFQNSVAGVYSISAKEIHGISQAGLVDTKTNTIHDLTEKGYEFLWELNDDENRFKLRLNAVGIDEALENESNLLIYTVGREIFIKGIEDCEVVVTDVVGRILVEEVFCGSDLISIPVILKTGFYVVLVKTNQGVRIQKIFIK